jgi:hypothetical protein
MIIIAKNEMVRTFFYLSIVIPSKAKESHNVLSNSYNAIYTIDGILRIFKEIKNALVFLGNHHKEMLTKIDPTILRFLLQCKREIKSHKYQH